MNSKLYFSTYTNLNWISILNDEEFKDIIIRSLQFLVTEKRIVLYAFVIMPNHMHLLWLIREDYILKNVQRDFLKYTAQQIRFKLIETQNSLIDSLTVNAKDRKLQIWERNGLSFQLINKETIFQKFKYIHMNPIKEKWSLASSPEEYFYSSASYYKTEVDNFKMLTHINELLF
ncbi:MAG: hypothetical protein JWO32_264 [Bacteroidetes bacterium]|nr:hypothetical protein [Bacteroidota bacterium]